MMSVIATGLSFVCDYFKNRQQIKAKKQERQDRIDEAVTTAQAKRIEQGNASAAELDKISIKQRGWKDEYLLILTTLPVLFAFIPDFAPYIAAGFEALANSVPEYYWYALGMIYIDTFGFRRMLRVAVEHWLSNRKVG